MGAGAEAEQYWKYWLNIPVAVGRGQMLANEASGSEIPDLGYVFDRVESLSRSI